MQVGLLLLMGSQLVLLRTLVTDANLFTTDMGWMAIFNGFGCTYLPYALANWAKRRNVSDSVMAMAYQIEPVVATMVAAPMIGQPVAAHVQVGVLFAVLGFILFTMHEARISASRS